MELRDVAIIAEAILFLATAGVAVFTVRRQNRKTEAEAEREETSAAQAITDAAIGLLKPMQDRIAGLELEIKGLRKEVAEAARHEEFLQNIISAKDKEIDALRVELEVNKKRIDKLERALDGVNVDREK